MQTDFVAHVSHQLKTPLSLLSAATETLQMDRIRSPEKLAEYLGHDSRRGGAAVGAGAARARVLARAAAAQLRVRARRSRRAGARDRRRLRARPVQPAGHVRRAPARARARSCCADPAALEQVVANLLDNAVKYSRAGQPVTVRVARRAAPRPSSRSTDRGVGIAKADQARIFERFYRVARRLAPPGLRPRPADRARARPRPAAGASKCRARPASAARSGSRLPLRRRSQPAVTERRRRRRRRWRHEPRQRPRRRRRGTCW